MKKIWMFLVMATLCTAGFGAAKELKFKAADFRFFNAKGNGIVKDETFSMGLSKDTAWNCIGLKKYIKVNAGDKLTVYFKAKGQGKVTCMAFGYKKKWARLWTRSLKISKEWEEKSFVIVVPKDVVSVSPGIGVHIKHGDNSSAQIKDIVIEVQQAKKD